MAKKSLPEQISTNLVDELRKELEGKIKDAFGDLKWIIGILTVISLAVFGYFALQISKIENLQDKVTRLEAKFEVNQTVIKKSS